MTLQRRLARLEAKRGRNGTEGPAVILLYAFSGDEKAEGEAKAAIVVGGGGYEREPGETESDFIARATRNASGAILLPDNGR